MNKILVVITLSLIVQFSFGQACGIYRIKYVGNIKSESLKIEKIKLPTIEFLHGLKMKILKIPLWKLSRLVTKLILNYAHI